MNVLIDCITLLRKNGAAEYQRRVISELFSRQKPEEINLIGLFDSRVGIAYEDMQPDILSAKGLKMLDVAETDIASLIESNNIDRFYIGCVQILAAYNGIEKLKCEVLCVVHDLTFEETEREDIDIYLRAQNKPLSSLLYWLMFKMRKGRGRNFIKPIVDLTFANKKVTLIAVSEYTKHSLIYTYGIPEKRIEVLYSPERLYAEPVGERSKEIRKLAYSGKPFFLLLGMHHNLKNTLKAVNAFSKFSQTHPEYMLLTTGRKIAQVCPQHLSMEFINDADLNIVYKSCHALIYPTLFEGFGYPPLEAMHYGKPVLASNIGPVREVYGDSPVYFSPLYETDIFQALNTFCQSDYKELSMRSMAQYKMVALKQKDDLNTLLNQILT